MRQVDYRSTFWFPDDPGQLWAGVEQLHLFPSWWGWLQDFQVDGEGLVPGTVLRGTVVPPVPYRLRLAVTLEQCEQPRLLAASVEGDLRGWATLHLDDALPGTHVTAAWSLQLQSPPLRAAARVAFPVLRWGHDRVVDMAVTGFSRRPRPGA